MILLFQLKGQQGIVPLTWSKTHTQTKIQVIYCLALKAPLCAVIKQLYLDRQDTYKTVNDGY